MGFRDFVKTTFNSCGWDLRRATSNPELTLLGIRSLPIKTVLDVGANTGQFASKIRAMLPAAKVVCFEPLRDAFSALENLARQSGGRIQPFNIAIGEENGTTEINRHVDHTASSSILQTTASNENLYPFTSKQVRETVSLRTLDSFLESIEFRVEPELLIKLDVQGYEDRVLRGATKTLNASTACIVEVCIESLYSSQARFRTLVDILDSHGLRYVGNMSQVYDADGRVIFLDAVFRRSVNE